MAPTITAIETIEYRYPVDGLGDVLSTTNSQMSTANRGTVGEWPRFGLRIDTDVDITGEFLSFVGSVGVVQIEAVADALIGRNPLRREKLWNDVRTSLKRYDGLGLGPLDIALWDFAGKYHDAPIHELLGTYRTRLPSYASTFYGQEEGGLDSGTAYADFAEHCLDIGYQGFKIHGFPADGDRPVHERDIDIVHAVGDRVGTNMALMLDGSCKYETWTQALSVGRACDEQGYFWYEDPYMDGGGSHSGHRRLREYLDTPLCQGELVHGVEAHTDLLAADATDILHVDPEYHGGITGAMKIANAAEAAGLDVQYHGPGPDRRHCMAATRNTCYYELGLIHPDCENPSNNPAYAGEYSDALETIDPDGTVPVPDRPGLGVDIDWDFVLDHAQHHRRY